MLQYEGVWVFACVCVCVGVGVGVTIYTFDDAAQECVFPRAQRGSLRHTAASHKRQHHPLVAARLVTGGVCVCVCVCGVYWS